MGVCVCGYLCVVVWVCLFLLVLVELILLILGGLSHVRVWDGIRMDTRLCLYVCYRKSLFMKDDIYRKAF